MGLIAGLEVRQTDLFDLFETFSRGAAPSTVVAMNCETFARSSRSSKGKLTSSAHRRAISDRGGINSQWPRLQEKECISASKCATARATIPYRSGPPAVRCSTFQNLEIPVQPLLNFVHRSRSSAANSRAVPQ